MALAQLSQDTIAAAKLGDQDETLSLLRELSLNNLRLQDVRDQLGSTPLHWTAAKGHKDLAKLLLSNGALVSAKNDAGDTPLHWAVTLNKPELVDLLINYNADLYEANKKGLRPLDVPTSNASIKAKLQSHHERVQEAKEAQTAEHDKLQVFMKSPSRLSSAGSVDVLASSPETLTVKPPSPDGHGSFHPPSFVLETFGSPPPTQPSSPRKDDHEYEQEQAAAPAPVEDENDWDEFDMMLPPPPVPAKPNGGTQAGAPPQAAEAQAKLLQLQQQPSPVSVAVPAAAPVAAASVAAPPPAAKRPSVDLTAQATPPAPPARPSLPPAKRTSVSSPSSSGLKSPTISNPIPITPTAIAAPAAPKGSGGGGAEDDDDDGGDDDDDNAAVKIEFWDATEEMQYQKMLVHFGKDMAEKALVELRRVREKRGEVPPWKRTAAATAATAPANNAANTKAANEEAAAIMNKVAASEQQQSFVGKNQTDEDRAKWEKSRQLHQQTATKTPQELENGFREDAAYDYVDGVKKAIELGVNVDGKDEAGMTALMLASASGHKKTMLALFKGKAKRNLKNKQGQTALHIAVTEGQAESLRLLIKYKAKVDVKDKEGRTPMMVACVKGDVPAIQALFEAGTTVDRPDKTGKTALMLAVFAEQPEAALYLIKSGEAQVDLVDKFGWSALMFGAHAGNINLVRMLLSNGANVNFVNKREKSAIQLAAEAGHTEIFTLLETHAASYPSGSSLSGGSGSGSSASLKRRTLNRKSSAMSLSDSSSSTSAASSSQVGRSSSISRAQALQLALDPDVNNWSEDDVGVWLLKLGEEFEPVVNLFRDNNISGRRLQRLTDDKLQQLGVSSMGLRIDILDEIANLSTTTRI